MSAAAAAAAGYGWQNGRGTGDCLGDFGLFRMTRVNGTVTDRVSVSSVKHTATRTTQMTNTKEDDKLWRQTVQLGLTAVTAKYRKIRERQCL